MELAKVPCSLVQWRSFFFLGPWSQDWIKLSNLARGWKTNLVKFAKMYEFQIVLDPNSQLYE